MKPHEEEGKNQKEEPVDRGKELQAVWNFHCFVVSDSHYYARLELGLSEKINLWNVTVPEKVWSDFIFYCCLWK